MAEISYSVKSISLKASPRFYGLAEVFTVERTESVATESEFTGIFKTIDEARKHAYAMCKEEHEGLGWPQGDERIRYPFRDSENG